MKINISNRNFKKNIKEGCKNSGKKKHEFYRSKLKKEKNSLIMINKYVKNETISPQLKTRTKQPISRCDFCNCFVVCLKCRTNNTLPQANAMNSLVQMKCFMNSFGLNSELFPFEVHFSFNDTLNFSLNMLEKMMKSRRKLLRVEGT